jgi:putative addiction module component (TIGR02574 family)
MPKPSEEILNAVLALPESEKIQLVERVLETLPPDVDDMTEEEFIAELDRRRAEVESGLIKPIPWSDVTFED